MLLTSLHEQRLFDKLEFIQGFQPTSIIALDSYIDEGVPVTNIQSIPGLCENMFGIFTVLTVNIQKWLELLMVLLENITRTMRPVVVEKSPLITKKCYYNLSSAQLEINRVAVTFLCK